MKTNFTKIGRWAFIFFSSVILLTTGCKKDSKPAAPVCKPVKMIAFPNNGAVEIGYTWTNQLITRAQVEGGYSAVFEYHSNNKIKNYKRYDEASTVPEYQYNFYYNSDGTYSKIEIVYKSVLQSYFEFQNSNGNISRIKVITVNENGQPLPEPATVWEFSYAGKNVSKVIETTRDGYVVTRNYAYDNQPNHLKKIHEQYPIMDFSINLYWAFDLGTIPTFFWGTNENNCTGGSIKSVAPDGTIEEGSPSYYYELDDKGNLKQFGIPPTSTSDFVLGRYTYECN